MMSKIARQTTAQKVAPIPGWMNDKGNQRDWNGRFIQILIRDYKDSDSTISAILSTDKLTQICSVKIRSYVDRNVTVYLYDQRKARGAKHRKQLEIAIVGLNAALELYSDRDNQPAAMYLGTMALELSAELGRCKEAYATKRHGRDRAHSTLSECRTFLESRLGQPVTCATLANLVNAGYEADGNPLDDPITEEHIRKNLAHFKRSNPSWRDEIDPRLKPRPADQATK